MDRMRGGERQRAGDRDFPFSPSFLFSPFSFLGSRKAKKEGWQLIEGMRESAFLPFLFSFLPSSSSKKAGWACGRMASPFFFSLFFFSEIGRK